MVEPMALRASCLGPTDCTSSPLGLAFSGAGVASKLPAVTNRKFSLRNPVHLAIGLAVVAMVGFGVKMVLPRDNQGKKADVGSEISAELTLIVSDSQDVDCSSGKGFEAFRCGYSDDQAPWNGSESVKLRPYMTGDRKLYLIPGLFTNPELSQRYRSEPQTVPRDQLKRFTAKCKLKVRGELDGIKVRWLQNSAWSEPQKGQVVTVVQCRVEG
jgi:hypothetical protein